MTTANGNGHAPTLPQLREQLREVRARQKLAQARRELQLSEGEAQLWALGWGDLLNPYSYRRDDGGGFWLPLNNSGPTRTKDGRNYPFFQTDADLDSMRALSYYLASKNDMAIGTLGACRDYTVKQGYRWEARPITGLESNERAASLAAQCQRVIDRDSTLNVLPQRERSAFWRGLRDGDVTVRHFRQSDGTTRHRFVRAEQLRDPGHLGARGLFGIECDEDDVETPLRYWITYDGTGFEDVPAAEVTHLKRNVDEEIKRGVSDFFSCGEAFDEVAKLLRAMRRGGTLLAKIAWIEEFANTTNDQIRAQQASVRDPRGPLLADPRSGRDETVAHMPDGKVIYTKDNRQFKAPPLAGNTANFTQIADACLRAAGTRWRIPEHIITGNASQNNVALILVAGAPFVNAVECEQDAWGPFFMRWRWVAIENACAAGLIDARFEEVRELVELHYTPPEVGSSDPEKQARVDSIDMTAGVLSLQTRAARRGLDWEQERKNLAEFPPTRVAGRATDLDAQGNPTNTGSDGVPDKGAPPKQAADAPAKPDLAETLKLLAAVQALQTAVYAGQIPRAAGIAGLVELLGVDRAEAERLLPPAEPEPAQGATQPPAPPTLESLLHEARGEGEVWQGPSGRWFTLKSGHVVPHKGPGGGGATAGAGGAKDAGKGDDPKLAKMGLWDRIKSAAADLGFIGKVKTKGHPWKEVENLTPAERADNSPPREEFARQLRERKDREAAWEHHAQKNGITVEEAKKRAVEKANKLIDGLTPAIRVDFLDAKNPGVPDTRALEAVLDGGEYKNQHAEGITSKRAINSRPLRRAIEEKSMGCPPDTPPRNAPNYGYMTDRRHPPSENVRPYGSLVLHLRPSVKERSTYSIGDSLMGGQNGEFLSFAGGEATPEALDPAALAAYGDGYLDSYDAHQKTFDGKQGGYIEAHVHDGLPVTDIESVEWPKTEYGEMPDRIKAKLTALNIPWKDY